MMYPYWVRTGQQQLQQQQPSVPDLHLSEVLSVHVLHYNQAHLGAFRPLDATWGCLEEPG